MDAWKARIVKRALRGCGVLPVQLQHLLHQGKQVSVAVDCPISARSDSANPVHAKVFYFKVNN
jgi:hypothetical protein